MTWPRSAVGIREGWGPLALVLAGCGTDTFTSVNDGAAPNDEAGRADARSPTDAATAGDGADATDAATVGDAASFDAASLGHLELWLRADTLTSSPVSTWYDPSTGISATTDGTCAAPALSTGTQKGIRYVVLDGTTNCFHLPTGFADFSAGTTAFVVANPKRADSETVSEPFLSLAAPLGSARIAFERSAGMAFFQIADATGGSLGKATVSDPSNSNWHIYEAHQGVVTGDPAVVLRDGQSGNPALIAKAPMMTRDTNFIGASPAVATSDAKLKADVGEILLFSRALDLTDRTKVERYLDAKWRP